MNHMVSFTIIPDGPKGGQIGNTEYSLSDLKEKSKEIAVLIQKSVNEAKKVLIKSSKYKTKRWTIDFNGLRIIKTAFLGYEYPLKQFIQNIHSELLGAEKLMVRTKCQK